VAVIPPLEQIGRKRQAEIYSTDDRVIPDWKREEKRCSWSNWRSRRKEEWRGERKERLQEKLFMSGNTWKLGRVSKWEKKPGTRRRRYVALLREPGSGHIHCPSLWVQSGAGWRRWAAQWLGGEGNGQSTSAKQSWQCSLSSLLKQEVRKKRPGWCRNRICS